MSEYSQLLNGYVSALANNHDWRAGQAAFNVLHDLRPDLADEIRGTRLDPFYRDAVGDEFWGFAAGRMGGAA
jgi:hypothetical protein